MNGSIDSILDNIAGPSTSNVNGEAEDLSCNKTSTVKEEKTVENNPENTTPKKGAVIPNSNTTNKAKKRKKILRDSKAPKQPLTGYFRFLNDRREKVRTENPTMPFSEITKQLAAEWNVLPTDQKQQYLDAAEQDKERYSKEFEEYKKTDAYKAFVEKQAAKKDKKVKKEKNEADNSTTSEAPPATNNVPNQIKNDDGTVEIPIFTEEFLEHNKTCEAELRQLRKSTTDYESQNAVLQRHVDSLHAAVTQLETDTNYYKTSTATLQQYLDKLRVQLVSCFSNMPLTDAHDGATSENVDSYIDRLDYLISNNHVEPALKNAVRTAITRVELIK
ncbi:high mobility group protein 20A-like [Phymastichus coffea]|uniref:high mobility group protein 20A-like n=1 Tax=Phymastichus coffea TaxID=108790 RepID=UPI00273AA564|nr:high mobility group protein 20A-like [Phymastichus coffea]